MKIYNYDRVTGEYLGIGKTDDCPITHTPIIPAWATDIEPPLPGEKQVVIFVNKEWMVKDIQPLEPEPQKEYTPEEIIAKNNASVKAEIASIESKQSRAVRELLLGDESAKERLQEMDNQITELRAQLK